MAAKLAHLFVEKVHEAFGRNPDAGSTNVFPKLLKVDGLEERCTGKGKRGKATRRASAPKVQALTSYARSFSYSWPVPRNLRSSSVVSEPSAPWPAQSSSLSGFNSREADIRGHTFIGHLANSCPQREISRADGSFEITPATTCCIGSLLHILRGNGSLCSFSDPSYLR